MTHPANDSSLVNLSADCAAWDELLQQALDERGDLRTAALAAHPQQCAECAMLWNIQQQLASETQLTAISAKQVSPVLTGKILAQLAELARVPETTSTVTPQTEVAPVTGARSPAQPRTLWWLAACCAAVLWGVFWSPRAIAPVSHTQQATVVTEVTEPASPTDLQAIVSTAGSAYQTLQHETVAAAQEFALLLPPQATAALSSANAVPQNAASSSYLPVPALPSGLQPIQQSVREGLDFLWLTVPQDLKSAG